MPEASSHGYCLQKCRPRNMRLVVLAGCLASSVASLANAQAIPAAHKQVSQLVDERAANFKQVSKQIWDYAELGYHEDKSSALLQGELKRAGFSVKSGVADEPTAFIASYGHGKPVIGILGEFDALPGLSQKPLPQREPVVTNAPGHGCGHNLLGSGAALVAVAVKEYMETNHVSGTLRYYGTPAEEGGSGKVFMVRDGLFNDVDVVLHWHPGDHNSVNNGGMLAVISAKVTFHGIAAHAAMAPRFLAQPPLTPRVPPNGRGVKATTRWSNRRFDLDSPTGGLGERHQPRSEVSSSQAPSRRGVASGLQFPANISWSTNSSAQMPSQHPARESRIQANS